VGGEEVTVEAAAPLWFDRPDLVAIGYDAEAINRMKARERCKLGTKLLQPGQFSDSMKKEIEQVLQQRLIKKLRRQWFSQKLRAGRSLRDKKREDREQRLKAKAAKGRR
jgi:hypothetical protein